MKALFLLLLISAAHGAPDLSKLACHEKVVEQLVSWKATLEWNKQQQGGLKNIFWASPTDVVGDWVLLREIPQGIVLAKVRQSGRVEVAMKSPECSKVINSYPHSAPAKNLKTDVDLEKFVDANKKGVIYVWSKRMGLSERGIADIKKASGKLKLPVLILEDKEIDSMEFKMRDVGNHYPAIMVFKDSKIIPGVKHGYEKSDLYQSDITRMLGPGK